MLWQLYCGSGMTTTFPGFIPGKINPSAKINSWVMTGVFYFARIAKAFFLGFTNAAITHSSILLSFCNFLEIRYK